MIRSIVVAFLVAIGGPALANSPDGDAAAAEALFDQGRELLEAGRTQQACAKFEASQRAEAAVGTLLNLGACYEALERSATAWARFREAEAMAQRVGDAAREKLARARADALEPRLARVRITLRSERVDDLEIYRDDTEIEPGALGTPLPVDPGEHTISARAPGFEPFRAQISATPGKTADILIELQPVEREPQPEATIHPDDRSDGSAGGHWRGPVGLGLVGVGAVAAGVGGYFGLRARSTWKDATGECPSEAVCTPRGMSLGEDAGRYADRATWLIAGGAVAATAGLLLWWTGPEDAGRGGRPAVSIAPAFGPHTGVVIEGSL